MLEIIGEGKTKDSKIISIILHRFRNHANFSRNELYEVYRETLPDLKESTFAWKIYQLKKRKIIQSIKRGVYTLIIKSEYRPDISEKLRRIFLTVKREKITDNINIWSSAWLNEFMIHQPMRYVIILEVDSDTIETVYYLLKDNIYKKIYMHLNKNQMLNYAMEEQEPVILLPFKGRSPVKKYEKILTPALEKILIDIFVNSKLFYWIQGEELINIFDEAHRKYQINYTTLIAYARRRGAENKLKKFMIKKTDIPKEMFL